MLDRRDELFAEHAQSPLTPPVRERFKGLQYYDYDPTYRVKGAVEAETVDEVITVMVVDDVLKYRQVGTRQVYAPGPTESVIALLDDRLQRRSFHALW